MSAPLPPGDYERLPCGCVCGTEEVGPEPDDRRFVFIPHALDCRYYLYAVEESRRQGKPVITIDAS